MFVVFFEEAVDRGLKVNDRPENAALQPPLGQDGEEPLDGVEPRTRRRREVEGEAFVPAEPCAHLGVLVGGVVVEDDVDILPAGTSTSIAFRKRMNS